ncbi:MAG: ABC transporter permease [Halanaerobiaceae bacterium]
MVSFLVRRVFYAIITLILVSILGFFLINLPPGTYLDVRLAELQSQGTSSAYDQIEALEKRYRLNRPIYEQYFNWVSGFFRGDFGRSFMYSRDVSELIGQRLGFTMVIAISTIIFTWVLAIPIGVYAATHQYTLGDNILTLIGFIGLSIPNFLLALIFMVIASQGFGQSVGGLFSETYRNAPWSLGKIIDLAKHMWIPIIVIGTAGTAGLIRVMRGNLLDVLNRQYVQTARAKGLQEGIVIYKHAVRTAIHPLIMQLGMTMPMIISGTTVVAIVLSLPTIGPMYFRALRAQDMFLSGAILVFMAILLIVGNLLADLALSWVDPRIRYE